jgi:predicted dehydrogenase
LIRIGVIGTNWITDKMIEAAHEVESMEVTAVYSRTEERAEEFAGKHGIANRYTDLEAMARSEVVDAVYVASPNAFHAEQAVMLMDHGKHVLCEKPMASNAGELSEMIKAAGRNRVVLMEAMKSTLLPNYRAIADNISRLGTIRRYFASYCQYSSRYDAYKAGTVLNAFKPDYSNGALMDLGIYCLYPMVALFGRPDKIRATGVMLESGVDGEGSIVCQYSQMDAVIMYSKITQSDLPSEIQGEDANLLIHKISEPQRVAIHYRNGNVEELSQSQTMHPMAYELQEFTDLIQSGHAESTINSHDNSLITLEIMDEVRRQIGLVYPADQNQQK